MKVDLYWAKVAKLGDGDCWEWLGSKDKDGYGKFGGKTERTHRIAYRLANGEITQGLCVCHSCDNRSCCNPAHLWLGTNQENTADKIAKGRNHKGDRVLTAKLTTDEVRAIRSLNVSQDKIAAVFGIAQTQVSRIIRREAWAHV